ncbi:potassium transporter KefA [Desulfuromonas versatilis]|uniref:Potassium transporter KefA n=1 Tax=Desulfuromonas versatilis TaxID=2802975 RepID=A0ABN6DUM8_9BACT|nr:mechanosensitive ion channel domain-containing protein [Desulfuromonas versatilis]BCR03815.1 potassium transporter KefA [Desulfuromonas versatilis]
MKDDTLRTIIEQFSLWRLALAAAFFLLTWLFLRLLAHAADGLAEKFPRYRLFIASLFPVLRLGIWIGAFAFVVFAVFSPPLNTIIAISASAGLAIGLGAQDLIKNLIAGVLILFDRPFQVGDMIEVGDHYGEVTNIGLRSICIRTFGDSAVTLPNAMVLGQAVSNSNSGALDEMVEVEFSLPAHVDVQLAKALAWEAAACSPYAFLKKPVKVMIEDSFDRTFLTRLKIKTYVLDVRYERLLASDISERFKTALVEQGMISEKTVLGLLPAQSR